MFGMKLWILVFGLAGINSQSADEPDDSDIEPIILNGLIGGTSQSNQQLLANPSLSLAADLFRTIVGQVVTHNLNAIEKIAQTNANCAVDPLKRSRNVLERARDQSFACLQQFSANTLATKEYSDCLKREASMARTEIDALKPIIDACLANAPAGSAQQGQGAAAVATAVNVNVFVNAVAQATAVQQPQG